MTLSLASSTGWIEAVQGELEMSVSMQLAHIHGVLRVVVLIVVQPVHLKPKCELLWCHIMMASCVYMWQVALGPVTNWLWPTCQYRGVQSFRKRGSFDCALYIYAYTRNVASACFRIYDVGFVLRTIKPVPALETLSCSWAFFGRGEGGVEEDHFCALCGSSHCKCPKL